MAPAARLAWPCRPRAGACLAMSVQDNLLTGAGAGSHSDAAHAGRNLRAVPARAGATRATGRILVGRRTADGGDRPRHDGQPAPADAGRAVAGHRAQDRGRDRFRDRAHQRDKGLAIILVEQNARLALRLSHQAYALEHGEIVRSGQGAELLADPFVQKAYLSVNDDASPAVPAAIRGVCAALRAHAAARATISWAAIHTTGPCPWTSTSGCCARHVVASPARPRPPPAARCPIEFLSRLGVSASDVDDVVLTHLHYDHAGNLDKLRAFVQDGEMDYATGRCMCHAPLRHA